MTAERLRSLETMSKHSEKTVNNDEEENMLFPLNPRKLKKNYHILHEIKFLYIFISVCIFKQTYYNMYYIFL